MPYHTSYLGVYRWEESHMQAYYTNWAPNKPNARDDYDCVWKSYLSSSPGWHDVPCSWDYDHPGNHGVIHALCEANIQNF